MGGVGWDQLGIVTIKVINYEIIYSIIIHCYTRNVIDL